MKFSFDGNGTLQHFLCVNPSSIPMIRKSPSLPFIQAAALPLVYLTAYTALIEYGKLPFDPAEQDKGKRTVLVLGGSSGTGSVAVQLAKKMGCKVVATCSRKNADFVKKLGADEVIDYHTENVAQEALRSPCAPYAVVLDCVGGTELIPHMEHLVLHDPKAPQLGIYVTIVGDKTSRDSMGGGITNYYYPSQAIRTFRGILTDYLPNWTPLRSWFAGKRYACIVLSTKKEYLETIPAFLTAGNEVIIDSVFSFADAKKAFEKLESGRAVGKVIVEMT